MGNQRSSPLQTRRQPADDVFYREESRHQRLSDATPDTVSSHAIQRLRSSGYQHPAGAWGHSEVRALQRTVGNQAVLHLLGRASGPADRAGRAGASNAGGLAVQRVMPDPKDPDTLRADADPSIPVTKDTGVISNVAAGSNAAHTMVYLESAEEDEGRLEPKNQMLDLTVGENNELSINMQPVGMYDLMLLRHASDKRAWARSNAQLDAAVAKAKEIQTDSKQYTYTFTGTHLFNDKAINCAGFGELVLQAAGLTVSAGRVFKTPMELATGKKDFLKSFGAKPKDEKKAEDAFENAVSYEQTGRNELALNMFVTALQLAGSRSAADRLLYSGELKVRDFLFETLSGQLDDAANWIESNVPRPEVASALWLRLWDRAKTPRDRGRAAFYYALAIEETGDRDQAKRMFEQAKFQLRSFVDEELSKLVDEKLKEYNVDDKAKTA